MRALLIVALLVAPAESAALDFDRARLAQSEYAAPRGHHPRRGQSDAALAARVKAALTAEGGLSSKAIAVEAYEGRVELSGFVPLPDMASRAGRVAAGVSGVRMVHNNIAVK
jgi:osmotically-inducible protein OsmY